MGDDDDEFRARGQVFQQIYQGLGPSPAIRKLPSSPTIKGLIEATFLIVNLSGFGPPPCRMKNVKIFQLFLVLKAMIGLVLEIGFNDSKEMVNRVLGYSSAGVKLVLDRGESGYVPYILDFHHR